MAKIVKPTPYDLYINIEGLRRLWPNNPIIPADLVVCCGFQAIELTWRLIDSAHEDRRPEADIPQRLERYVDLITSSLRTVAQSIDAESYPVEILDNAAPRAKSPGFALVPLLSDRLARRITETYFSEFGHLPYDIGIGPQMSQMAQFIGSSGTSTAQPRPSLPYEDIVSPHDVYAIHRPEKNSPEDHLFAGAHQIVECWLRLVHHFLDESHSLAVEKDWDAASEMVRHAWSALDMATEASQLLDLMNLADYHPLRVRLRDGSGAQSIAARTVRSKARMAINPLLEELRGKGTSIIELLENPTRFSGQFKYLQRISRFGKKAQEFLFKHYLLALGVIGHRGHGSLGYEVNEMASRAASPVFPEIDQAHYDFAIITNLEHGASAGEIISRRERERGICVAPETTPCDLLNTSERALESVYEYFRFVSEGNAAAWVELFDPVEGRISDAGSRPFIGRARLMVFIESFLADFPDVQAAVEKFEIKQNSLSVKWVYRITAYNGLRLTAQGVENFTFSERGKILTATSIWDPKDLAGQLRAGLSPCTADG